MQLYYPVGMVLKGYQPNLSVQDIKDLNTQMNCNLYNSEENELWFDEENPSEMINEVESEWFFEYV